MKTSLIFVITLIIFLPIQIFSQEKSKMELRLAQVLPERIISKSFSKEQVQHLTELPDWESKTIVNKTILDNGFLLIEEFALVIIFQP